MYYSTRAAVVAAVITLAGISGAISVAAASDITFASVMAVRETNVSLLEAVSKGDLALARQILTAGTNVNQTDEKDGRTPLMLATGMGRTDLVRLLLDHKANANIQDKAGRTALHYVLSGAGGAAPKKKKRGFGDLARLAGDTLSDGNRETVGKNVVAEQLLRGLVSKGLGQSLLSEHLSTVLAPGASFDPSRGNHWSAVLGAALAGNEKAMLGNLSRFDTKDPAAWTHLLQSAGHSYPELLTALRNAETVGASKAAWNDFVTAAEKGDERTVRNLLATDELTAILGTAGAGLNAAMSALPGRDGGAAIVESLLAHGANAGLKDETGATPLKRAQNSGLNIVVELLGKAPTL